MSTTTKRYGNHVVITTRKMPIITKGAVWMSDAELLDAIATLEAWEAVERCEKTVKADRIARYMTELEKRTHVRL